MKKKIIILLSVVIILLMGIVVWFNIPLDLMDLDPNEVMEIVVFNGNWYKFSSIYSFKKECFTMGKEIGYVLNG